MSTAFASKPWMETESGVFPRDGITRLDAGDLILLRQLLDANGQPAIDCDSPSNRFFGIFEDRRLIAAGGLEDAGRYCLLRSLVVASDCRGRGLAHLIGEHLLELARAENYLSVYLLTGSAADYFTRLGFVRVDRSEVPASISATRQFAKLCPDSADCLMLRLSQP